MARAQQAQTKMGQVGKIQHKPVEKVFTKKEREEMKKEAKKDPRAGDRKAILCSPSRNGANANRNGAANRPKDPRAAAKARAAAAEEENQKKLKKAAIATTGYTGTARPKPGAASAKKKPAPGGALLNARPARVTEDDEELDDFIEYDEDEEEAGPRYTYDSDGSSDMEAGMDDVWEEEAKAERVARLEDIEQEKLEKRLKVEKEERKRRFYEQQRARR
ncbi:SPT2 chromatin protein [Colletotrichum tofieldiae]|nr:SPT2 chromatin protein [Colletotrichum tofieldiae]